MKNKHRLVILGIGIVAVSWLSLNIAKSRWNDWKKTHWLSFAPTELNISTIIYVEEKLYGIGPGGNEAGIIVYQLPEATALEIERKGIDYFKRLPSTTARNYTEPGHYLQWQETPITGQDDWLVDENSGQSSASTIAPPQLTNYLNRYGFGIEVEPEVEAAVNKAIVEAGSYVGDGRNGMLIVIPARREVVYVYSG